MSDLLSRVQSPAVTLFAEGNNRQQESAAQFGEQLLSRLEATANVESTSDGELATSTGNPSDGELRQAFDDFVGQTLFGSMLAEMRKGLEGPAYFGGGRTEAVFQGQLDQHMVEEISRASASSITEPMYDLFMVSR